MRETITLRKRIAILSSQLEENYQANFMQGFLAKAFAFDYDVCTFATYRKYQDTSEREVGETSIFSLIDYDAFDGVVVLPETLQTPGLMLTLEQDFREKFQGKILYVDRKSDEYNYIMLDHYHPIKRMIAHLIEEHGIKDIMYLTGPRYNAHSEQRLQGFLDCMKEQDIDVREDQIFYGDYWYDGGRDMVKKLFDEGRALPQAIACANDLMAVGVAEALAERGVHVPEDIAVIGYDSVPEGKESPSPITSMDIPSREFGEYAAACMDSLLKQESMPEFEYEAPLFIGGSCGCHCESVIPRRIVREQWSTEVSRKSFYSNFNHLTEDWISQNSFPELMDAVQTYSYQIREFDSFHICVNDLWIREDKPASVNIIKGHYTDQIAPVLHCGPSGKGEDRLNFTESFPREQMLPEIYEESATPKAYIFSPLYFEDMCFGYAVLGYGNEPKAYDERYYMWLHNLMIGMECFRRMDALQRTNQRVQEKKIHDELTGMFNYTGFVKHSKPMVERACEENRFVSVLAMDMANLDKINEKYGRTEGDRAIRKVAGIIQQCADEGAMCCRLGDDEFIMAELVDEASHEKIHEVRRRIDQSLEEYNQSPQSRYELRLFSGSRTERVKDLVEMEDLVNAAVISKNGHKASEKRLHGDVTLSVQEQEQAAQVKKVLDENLFTYHFQPIVSAKDGSVVAYEALMRAQVQPGISPINIIKYASHLERLYDVERATFFNILQLVDEHENEFADRKIFINSIPGSQLSGEEAQMLEKKLTKHANRVVVELTEQTEADDKTLADMKSGYEKLGIETAVDDYGTGYSNIVNLLRYMPNYVKVDRMLLTGIQDNPQKQHFVKDIVIFAHENHFQVLAEGVETSQELETVIRLGVDLIQGYYTAKPNPEILTSIDRNVQEEICRYQKESA